MPKVKFDMGYRGANNARDAMIKAQDRLRCAIGPEFMLPIETEYDAGTRIFTCELSDDQYEKWVVYLHHETIERCEREESERAESLRRDTAANCLTIRNCAARASRLIPRVVGDLGYIHDYARYIRERSPEPNPRTDQIDAATRDAERHLRDYQTAMARVTLLAAEMEAGT